MEKRRRFPQNRKFKPEDVVLLQAVQQNARISSTELGKITKTSANSCQRRMKNWEETGLIKGYRTLLNYKQIGFDLMEFITVSFVEEYNEAKFKAFEESMIEQPRVIGCWKLTGDLAYLLCVVAENSADLDALLGKLENDIPIKCRHTTMLVVKEVKNVTPLPLDTLEKKDKTYLQITPFQ